MKKPQTFTKTITPVELLKIKANAEIKSRVIQNIAEAAAKEMVFVNLFEVVAKLHSMYEVPEDKEKPHLDSWLSHLLLRGISRELKELNCICYDVSTDEIPMDVVIKLPDIEAHNTNEPNISMEDIFK